MKTRMATSTAKQRMAPKPSDKMYRNMTAVSMAKSATGAVVGRVRKAAGKYPNRQEQWSSWQQVTVYEAVDHSLAGS